MIITKNYILRLEDIKKITPVYKGGNKWYLIDMKKQRNIKIDTDDFQEIKTKIEMGEKNGIKRTKTRNRTLFN